MAPLEHYRLWVPRGGKRASAIQISQMPNSRADRLTPKAGLELPVRLRCRTVRWFASKTREAVDRRCTSCQIGQGSEGIRCERSCERPFAAIRHRANLQR